MPPSVLAFCFLALVLPRAGVAADAEKPSDLEVVEVVGTPLQHGIGLPRDRIPANTQGATAADLERTQSLDVADFLGRNLDSVTVNAAQGNPLQPDVQFRGFTLSPVLGVAPGVAVYQDGVRVNEPFGDTVSWDLLPESAIDSINLFAGANPLFGLNALGGALSIRTKDGFRNPGHELETYGGSFGRSVTTASSGANDGTWGYFATARYFREDGWRDFSPSDALNAFGTLGWRRRGSAVDLSVTHADTSLHGNGPAPIELVERDRAAVFTHPDVTRDDMQLVNLRGTQWLNDRIQLSGNAFFRRSVIRAANGDVADPDQCARPGGCPFDAVDNGSTTDQESDGGTLESTWFHPLFGHENQLIVGASYYAGRADFDSTVEAARFDADRGVVDTGVFLGGEGTDVTTSTRTASTYFAEALSLTPELGLTVSGRYDHTGIDIRDRSGREPALDGTHGFHRFNPAAGATYRLRHGVSAYLGYGESARTPTPVELTCADPAAPCRLPNAFLADPPLAEVVARSAEAGFRGAFHTGFLDQRVNWHVGAFGSVNTDDIIFQTRGATANRGFFANVGNTARRGVELGFRGVSDRLVWTTSYSWLKATFEDRFRISSPHHPDAVDFNHDGIPDGLIVEPGDRIPGLPEHSLKLGGDYSFASGLRVGADLLFNSAQFLRGDEANRLQPLGAYAIVGLRGEYRFNRRITAFARIENLFDTDYETFGLLAKPNGPPGLGGLHDPRFVGAGAPRAGWVGLRIDL